MCFLKPAINMRIFRVCGKRWNEFRKWGCYAALEVDKLAPVAMVTVSNRCQCSLFDKIISVAVSGGAGYSSSK